MALFIEHCPENSSEDQKKESHNFKTASDVFIFVLKKFLKVKKAPLGVTGLLSKPQVKKDIIGGHVTKRETK